VHRRPWASRDGAVVAHRDPAFEAPVWSHDGALHSIKIPGGGADAPEFQRPMTGTELRYRLGKF
jgi:hypothetical protein